MSSAFLLAAIISSILTILAFYSLATIFTSKSGLRSFLFGLGNTLSFVIIFLLMFLSAYHAFLDKDLVIFTTLGANIAFSVLQVIIIWSYFFRKHRIKRIVLLTIMTFLMGINVAGSLYFIFDGIDIVRFDPSTALVVLTVPTILGLSTLLAALTAYVLIINDIAKRIKIREYLAVKSNITYIIAGFLYPISGLSYGIGLLFFPNETIFFIMGPFIYIVVGTIFLLALAMAPRYLMVEYLEAESALEGTHPHLFINFAFYYFSTLGPAPLLEWFPKYSLEGKQLRDFLLEIGIKGMNFITLRFEEGATFLRIELDRPEPSSVLFLGTLGTIENSDQIIVDERFESRPYIALCLIGSPYFDWLFNNSSQWLLFFKKELESHPLEELTVNIIKEKIKKIFCELIK